MAGEEQAWNFIIRVPDVEPDLTQAALVVIDLQYSFASRDTGVFRRLRENGLGDQSNYAIDRLEEKVIPNVARLIDAFRAAGRPVFYTRSASVRGDGSDQTARHRAQGLVVPVWSHDAEILSEIAPQQGDLVLTKTGSGSFTSTNLDHLLRTMKVDTVVLAGMWTNSCVETTARHAGDLDYDVVLVEDGCVAMTPENHAWALNYLGDNFAAVRDTASLVAMVDGEQLRKHQRETVR